jgi:hypothetical protein
MKKIALLSAAVLALLSMAGCAQDIGMGKGKAPPPVVTKGWASDWKGLATVPVLHFLELCLSTPVNPSAMSFLVTLAGVIGRLCFWLGILTAIASIITAIGALAYPPNPPPAFWHYDFPILASCGLWAVAAVAVGWAIRYVLSGLSGLSRRWRQALSATRRGSLR